MLDLIYSNIRGKITPTHTSYQYPITFIYDISKYTIIYLLKLKSQAFSKFKEYKACVENDVDWKSKILSNDGGEYIFEEFTNFSIHQNIQRQMTTPCTLEQNGLSKKKNQTLFDVVFSMLHHFNFTTPY